MSDLNTIIPNKKYIKNFFCIRCSKHITEYRTIHKHFSFGEPCRGYTNVNYISWNKAYINYKKQLVYYKKNKSFMYPNKTLSKKELIEARLTSSRELKDYFIELTQQYPEKTNEMEKVKEDFLDKQINLGYEVLTMDYVIAGSGRSKAREIIYLVKDDCVYLPFRNDNRDLIKVGYVDDIYYEDSYFRVQDYSKEYIDRYELTETSTKDDKDHAFVDNICKIDTRHQVYFDKDDQGWIIAKLGYFFKKYVIKKYKHARREDAFDDEYGYDESYYTTTFREGTRTFIDNGDKPTNAKVVKHVKSYSDTMNMLESEGLQRRSVAMNCFR